LQILGHLSPFEHASFTFLIEGVSRVLLAQLTRHRIASFSVRSQRYVKEENFGYIVPPAIEELGTEALMKYKKQMATLSDWYHEWNLILGDKGESSNEDARFILPNATETKIMMTMNARELFHFFELRCCHRAQWEIRQLANHILEAVTVISPALFDSAGARCQKGESCKEREILGCKGIVDKR